MSSALASCSLSHVVNSMGANQNDDAASSFADLAHHQEGRFVSTPPVGKVSARDYTAMIARFVFGKKVDPFPQSLLPFINLEASAFSQTLERGYKVTWLGHSTTMIEIDGLRILTDPVFGERASPFTNMGPKRFQKAPINLADLPPLDAVVISHDHYDHLDMESIKLLHPQVKQFITPLGVGVHLIKWGVPSEKIIEKDWWQEVTVENKVRLVATPARHFSGRGVLDKNKTLWASWVIIGSEHSLFFSGDTGMHDGFTEIGNRFGPFDLAMIENGAYDKDWPDVHMQPEETIKAAIMLKAKILMPIHWGTFELANHPWYEPAYRIHALAEQHNIPLAQPRQGEAVGLNIPLPLSQWWKVQPVQLTEKSDASKRSFTPSNAGPSSLSTEG